MVLRVPALFYHRLVTPPYSHIYIQKLRPQGLPLQQFGAMELGLTIALHSAKINAIGLPPIFNLMLCGYIGTKVDVR